MKHSRYIPLPVSNAGRSDSPCPCSLLGTLLSPSSHLSMCRKASTWLEEHADTLPPLLLRILLAYEFGEAGLAKLYGENWFTDIAFPFPFGLLPAAANWWLATGMEIVGSIALLLGWRTRFFGFALIVLTVVAIRAAHWPAEWHSLSDLSAGYAITDEGHGNFKLPLLYLAMLMPLWFGGAGRWSLDAWLSDATPAPRVPGGNPAASNQP